MALQQACLQLPAMRLLLAQVLQRKAVQQCGVGAVQLAVQAMQQAGFRLPEACLLLAQVRPCSSRGMAQVRPCSS